MARDRQRAKDRQAARRAERLAQRGGPAAAPRTSRPDDGLADEALRESEIEELADLEVGAPPQNVGRSDTVVESPPPPPDVHPDDLDLADDEALGTGPRGVRGTAAPPTHQRARVVAFLAAVWAELQRVQWPDRRQLVQLTGVVLFFVLVIGGYLGGLDAIFSKLINLIL